MFSLLQLLWDEILYWKQNILNLPIPWFSSQYLSANAKCFKKLSTKVFLLLEAEISEGFE